MADWLAYGLEEAFAETPEIGILRKPRLNTGLIRTEQRGESYDWPSAARDMLNADKPDFVVIMLGLTDRRGIREAHPRAAGAPACRSEAGRATRRRNPRSPLSSRRGPRAAAPAEKPADAEAPPQAQAPAPEQETSPRSSRRSSPRPERWCTSSARRNGASFMRGASTR